MEPGDVPEGERVREEGEERGGVEGNSCDEESLGDGESLGVEGAL